MKRFIFFLLQALGDGLMDFMARWRSEIARPKRHQASDHPAASEQTFWRIIDALELEAQSLTSDTVDIGSIAIARGLAYADFRFERLDWRSQHSRLAAWFEEISARPSFVSTAFVEG